MKEALLLFKINHLRGSNVQRGFFNFPALLSMFTQTTYCEGGFKQIKFENGIDEKAFAMRSEEGFFPYLC